MRHGRQHATGLGLVTSVLALLVLAGCSGMPTQDKQEDAKARADYYEQAAKTYYDGGRYQSAVRMWDQVLKERPDDQWAKFGLGKSLQMLGSSESSRSRAAADQALVRAEAVLAPIIPLDWTHPTLGDRRFEVESTLANVYSDRADLLDRDARALRTQLANDPNADTASLQQHVDTQIAKRNELLRKAIPLWQEVLAQNRDNPYALAGLAKSNLMMGNDDAGIAYANQYVRVSRTSQQGWRNQEREWEKTAKQAGVEVTAEQRSKFQQKISGARNKEIGVHLLLGSVYMRREQFSKAVSEYDEVLSLDPSIPAAYIERAQAYAALTLYPQAVKDAEQYLKMTDPAKQRAARVNAAELLDRYRRLAGEKPFLPADGTAAPPAGAATPGSPPAPPPRAPASPPPDAWGSPDGPPAGR